MDSFKIGDIIIFVERPDIPMKVMYAKHGIVVAYYIMDEEVKAKTMHVSDARRTTLPEKDFLDWLDYGLI